MPPRSAELLAEARAFGIDVARIEEDRRALAPPYRIDDWTLPLPPWARRPYAEDGPAAWRTLQQELGARADLTPLCIYLHIPFCRSKCGFCDCYSFALSPSREADIDAYVGLLEVELETWSALGNLARRPVSTVHLGGGSPGILGPDRFRRLMARCRELFATRPDTEWALESTVTDLTPELLATLEALDFRRLHIGVQSLEDPVRLAIGRRRPADRVVATAADALDRGWIVSVDLICGLPEQTMTGFLGGIRMLLELGIDGFSLYELLVYPQNARWAERWGLLPRRHDDNYLMFQAGLDLLERHGYRKNLFNHLAGPRDRNVYFTFPTRGEDLLAVGAIADGVFGAYHYRHPIYPRYRAETRPGAPALEGGLVRDAQEEALKPLTTALLAGTVPAGLRPQLAIPLADGGSLEQLWLDRRLVAPTPNGDLALTGSGSWLVGNMLRHLERAPAEADGPTGEPARPPAPVAAVR